MLTNPRTLFRTISLVFAISSIPSAAWAQAYPTRELLSTTTTVVGEIIRYPTTGPARITANIVTIAPGAETVFHRHPAPMFAYILEGEVTVDYGAEGKRVFRKGEALVEAMYTIHRGTNLGTTTVSILSVHMGAEGTQNVELMK
ncbi:cupin domain-containing protein [Propionivibrio sp.]|uniref:cupin domain-containing protein n=1 Tax=Propionivibrio sp. TaxID=2212460 RepID=UPI003BEF9EE3